MCKAATATRTHLNQHQPLLALPCVSCAAPRRPGQNCCEFEQGFGCSWYPRSEKQGEQHVLNRKYSHFSIRIHIKTYQRLGMCGREHLHHLGSPDVCRAGSALRKHLPQKPCEGAVHLAETLNLTGCEL